MQTIERPNILVVDDVDNNINFILQIVKHLNINIITALSGKEALHKIKDVGLALALIDISMPEMDGLELASIILKDETRDLVPIIFVTAHLQDEINIEKCYDSGIIDIILKPFRKNVLVRKVEVYLELYRQKQKILDSENMYRLLLNASPEGIIIMDIEGVIREISNTTSKVFRMEDKHYFIGKNIVDLFPKEERLKILDVIKQAISIGLVQNEEFILHKADQTKFISEISVKFIPGIDSRPNTLMAIIRDISQRKKMEQQLIHTERMAGLGEMAAGIAHEINQPLNIMSLSFENIIYELKMNKTIEEASLHNRSNKIFECIFRIGQIIDHIRVFSREQQDYIHTFFDINESIINAQSMVAEQFKLKKIELINDLNKKSTQVIGNTYKFEQVILNLLLNAKDAIHEKEEMFGKEYFKCIEIKSLEKEHNVYIDIIDNGIGIKPEDIQKIMLPFYSTKPPGKGTGLGLSISFGIIKEMKGTIEVTSEYKMGAKISIILPVEHANIKQIDWIPEKP